ncbi:MAG: hypothetical protein GXO07_06835 [Crenarchaeota archaeon]|nr:hypothetical protein [Thermoproteota archaeon]
MRFVLDNLRVLRSSKRSIILEMPKPVGFHGWSFEKVKVKLLMRKGKVEVFEWNGARWVPASPGVLATLRKLPEGAIPFLP